MIDGSKRVEFDNVHVLAVGDLLMMCQVGDSIVRVSSLQMLPGTTIADQGDRGRLVLSRRAALVLGLISA